MGRTTFRQTAIVGLAFLVSFPNARALAMTLREEAVSYRVQGYEAQRRGDRENALTFYRKAAQLDPSYPTPYNDAGVMLEELGRLDEAERAYQQALVLNPNYPEAHANLAMLYERRSEKEKAIYHWMKRYQLGDSGDFWAAKAEERLVALGALSDYPGLKGQVYHRRRLLEDELKAHTQSSEDFRAVTDQHRDWP